MLHPKTYSTTCHVASYNVVASCVGEHENWVKRVAKMDDFLGLIFLIISYGGPDSNQVFNRYKISWETYICLNHDVIIAYIDGRGSGRKGDNMLFANYRRLGTAEVEDQIEVTR